MENNFIQMTASTGHLVAYTIGSIFKHIIEGGQIISFVAYNAIFKNTAQNIQCSFGCVARSAVLLKPNVSNTLLFNFCELKFIIHGPITIAIEVTASPCSFSKKNGPQSAPNSDSFWGASAFQCMRASFLCPKYDTFACLHTRQDQN